MVQVQFWLCPIGHTGCGGDVCKVWCPCRFFSPEVIGFSNYRVEFVVPVVGERGHILSRVLPWYPEHRPGVYSWVVNYYHARLQNSVTRRVDIIIEEVAEREREGAAYERPQWCRRAPGKWPPSTPEVVGGHFM